MIQSEQSKPKALFVVSLGCPKNLVDSEIVSGNLLSSGFAFSFDPEEADLYFINTCAFLSSAREEAASEIALAAEWKNARPGRQIAIGGCLCSHQALDEYKKKFPEVDFWIGVNDIARVAEIVGGAAPTGGKYHFLCDETMPRLQFTLPHLAYLKIADGCDNRCSYCAIPDLRGSLRSRPADSILAEAKNLIANGVRELIVIAQDITVYGVDRPESGEEIAQLLRKLDALPGNFRLRLLYTHPAHYTDDFIAAVAECRKVLPYLDIPLQHVSDRILTAMNRHVTKAEIETLLKKLRKAIPDLTLRTTFITGLPGETEAEFEELCAFAAEYRFERLGVFPYSPEPGTPAAAMADQIPPATASERAEKLMKAQHNRMGRFNRALIGREMEVLIDTIDEEFAIARGAMDAPDIDQEILFPIPKRSAPKPGNFVTVRCMGVHKGDLVCELVKEKRGKGKP